MSGPGQIVVDIDVYGLEALGHIYFSTIDTDRSMSFILLPEVNN